MITGRTRRTVVLRSSRQLAAGGEGVVYLLPELPDLVAKIYHSPAPGIDVKLGLMIQNPPRIPPEEEGRVAIAWPEDTLLEPSSNRVVGFLMSRVLGSPIIEYFNPLLRPKTAPHFTYEHLLAAARNLAESVDIFHGQRSVIGDLNESNVLVTESGSIALIDTDSFQVLDRLSGRIYRSPVGKPEYTPAELQGHRFDTVDRNSDHDLFGLAVIIYQLLMEGIHPFLGRYTGSGDPPQLENRIAAGHFPHSRIRSVPFEPSPISPPWDSLHPTLLDEFVQCFDRGHDNPHTRPTAHEWVRTLEDAQAFLTSCGNNAQHRYFRHLPECPWCARALRMGGRDPFAPLPFGVQPVQPSFQPFRSPLTAPTVSPSVQPSQPPSSVPRQTNSGGRNNARSTQRRPRGAAFGLIVNDRNEILLIQRGYGRERGKWSLPGGNQDRGESLKRTAVRETREETGIRMSAGSLYYKGRRHNFEVWKGRYIGGRLKIQRHECWDAKWFSKDMLPHDDNLAFNPDRIVIGKWAKETRGSRRVHYPHRVKLGRVGFGLIVNRKKEVLLVQQSRGIRKGKWTLPGGVPRHKESRRAAAMKGTHNSTGVKFNITRLYYTNRHHAQIWLGEPETNWLPWSSKKQNDDRPGVSWFPIDKLPDRASLAFAVDVRTIEKWASENPGSRRVRY